MYSYGLVNRFAESHASGHLSIHPFIASSCDFKEGFMHTESLSEEMVNVFLSS